MRSRYAADVGPHSVDEDSASASAINFSLILAACSRRAFCSVKWALRFFV